jgi:type IV pilus assembly protein PilQ
VAQNVLFGNKSVIVGVRRSNVGNVVNTSATDWHDLYNEWLNVNLPLTSAAGKHWPGHHRQANYSLDLELPQRRPKVAAKLISSPRVITANSRSSDPSGSGNWLRDLSRIPTGGGAGSGTATVAFKDAVLELKVTPTITADNRIYLLINVTKDALAGYITVPGSGQVPTINTRSINTSALVDNGQTVVLGRHL